MHRKHRGAQNELMALCWLMGCGYEVFRNVSQHGPIDIIAIKDGEPPLFLDVKTALMYPTPEQEKLGVKILVNKNGQFYIEEFLKRSEALCVVCGKIIGIGTRRRYCSGTCKNRVLTDAARERRHAIQDARKAETTVVAFKARPRVRRAVL
jgi:hypothetical protein